MFQTQVSDGGDQDQHQDQQCALRGQAQAGQGSHQSGGQLNRQMKRHPGSGQQTNVQGAYDQHRYQQQENDPHGWFYAHLDVEKPAVCHFRGACLFFSSEKPGDDQTNTDAEKD